MGQSNELVLGSVQMIYFTSDNHFNHANIIKYCNRPFESVEEMNEHMVEKWNSVVTKDDVLLHLGDFSLSRNAVIDYVQRLNGTKILVMGNHDWCHPLGQKTPEKAQKAKEFYIDAGFKDVLLKESIPLPNGQIIELNHFPYVNHELNEERYPHLRPKNYGRWLLHGHVHCAWKTKDKMINVGVDVWDYVPVSIDQIMEIIK